TLVPAIAGFDDATARASHEYVESATDPYPFTGWLDPTKWPWWMYGELADICEFDPKPWGKRSMVGGIAVSTYWSNAKNACVPASQPTLSIAYPKEGASIPWQVGGPAIPIRADAMDPLDGAFSTVAWTVDNVPLG